MGDRDFFVAIPRLAPWAGVPCPFHGHQAWHMKRPERSMGRRGRLRSRQTEAPAAYFNTIAWKAALLNDCSKKHSALVDSTVTVR
jgi:hypothetical protein